MTIVLHLFGLLFIISAIGSCALAKTSINEIGGLVCLLIGVVFIGTGLLFDRLTSVGKVLLEIRDRLPLTSPPPGPGALVCGNCRKEIPEGARVCPHCSTKLALPARPG